MTTLPHILLGSALALFALGALLSLLLGRSDRAALAVGSGFSLTASLAGLTASVMLLLSGDASVELSIPWSPPIGAISVGLDPLTCFFLLCLFAVNGLALLFARSWLLPASAREREGREGDDAPPRLGPHLALLNLLALATAGILVARDAVLFLVCWELMSLASYFLVATHHARDEVRRGAFVYLIASHAALVFLLILFGSLAHHAGSFGFAAMMAAGVPAGATGLFLVALAGFGIKAALWPLHIWLPDTYGVAPPHVASFLSGILMKLGLYGILRTLLLLGEQGPTLASWGAVLVALGVVTGLIGVLNALAQRDLTRLLACSSIENVGLIAVAIGLGLLARAEGHTALALLANVGALLHVLNHGLFKGLLFQTAAGVQSATGTRQLDALGGLYRAMPRTGLLFLMGAVAISGLPPFNGFISEWLILITAFRESAALTGKGAFFAVFGLTGVALVGGLAAFCFVRAFGILFLGQPRTALPMAPRDPPRSLLAAPTLSALLCLVLGVVTPLAAALTGAPAALLAGQAGSDGLGANGMTPFLPVGIVALLLLVLVIVLALIRRGLLSRLVVREGPLWACAYPLITPRMQYTAASFSQPALSFFSHVLPRKPKLVRPEGYFPKHAMSGDDAVGDLVGERLLIPAIRRALDAFGRVRLLQHGKLHLYLLYILVTLVALLAWQFSSR